MVKSDRNECTDDVCTDGVCSNPDNSNPCDDGQFCTATDVCSGGLCVGSGETCQAGETCNDVTDHCDTCQSNGECDDSKGYFIAPTLVQAKKPDFKLMEEEIFGPVICVYEYDDLDDALARARLSEVSSGSRDGAKHDRTNPQSPGGGRVRHQAPDPEG